MRLTLLGILLGGLLLAAACGGDDEKTTTTTATTRSTNAASGSAGAGQQINVTVKEYEIAPEKKSANAGKITFNVENKGTVAHEFLVFKTDLGLDELPLQSDGTLDEEDPALEMIDEITEFNPGQKKSLSVDLEPGKYVLVCNVGEETGGQEVSHFANGMRTTFTVE